MDKMIKIIIDSNIVYSRKLEDDFCEICWGPKLNTLESWIAIYGIDDRVKIIFPEIVMREIHKQYVDLYEVERKKLLQYIDKKIFPDIKIQFDVEEEFNFKDYIEQKIYQTIKRDIFLEQGMDFPINATNLIERAINKKKPFCGENKQSDKGFKDAVLWESILDYKKKNPYHTLILYTNDRAFSEDLIFEYKELFHDDIFIFHEEKELLGCLKKLCDIKGTDEQLEKYEEIKGYLAKNISQIKNLYIDHIISGSWYENIQEVEIKSIYFEDLYIVEYEENPRIKYESIYYIKSYLVNRDGEQYNLNLHFYVDIDSNYNLSVMGSGVGYMRFKK